MEKDNTIKTKGGLAKNILAVVGSIAIVITAIVGVFDIKDKIFPSGPRLKVEGDYYPFSVPTEFFDQSKKDYDFLKNSDQATTTLYDFSLIDSVWIFDITNAGNSLAEGIQLEGIPSVKFYSVNQDKKIFPFENYIKVGELKPSNKISVVVWSSWNSSSGYIEKETKIVHESGVSKIKYPIKMKGFRALVARLLFSDLVIFFLLFALIMTPGFIFMKWEDKKSKNIK